MLITLYLVLPAGDDLCDCDGMASKRSFDYWFPCHFNTKDPGMLLAHIDCELLTQQDELGIKPTSEIRMHLIHSTVCYITVLISYLYSIICLLSALFLENYHDIISIY